MNTKFSTTDERKLTQTKRFIRVCLRVSVVQNSMFFCHYIRVDSCPFAVKNVMSGVDAQFLFWCPSVVRFGH